MAPNEQAVCLHCFMTSRWHGVSAPEEDDCLASTEAGCRAPAEASRASTDNISLSADHLPPPNEALSLKPQTPLPGDLGLDPNLWRLIFSCLPIDNLPAAAAVCRVWRGVIADPEVWVSSFVNRWKLGRLHGAPASRGFWRGGLSQFVVAHWLQPEDSVVSVAIKFGVEVTAVKRQNNIISDHSIHVRERLLIPVPDAKYLEGKDCYVEIDKYSRREVAVLYAEGSPGGKKTLQKDALEGGRSVKARAQSKERFREKMVETLRKGLKVDDATARYYLAQSGWDLRGAYAAYQVDVAWESQRQSRRGGRS